MSHYETLGVPQDATPEQIKAAYRAKAMAAHPDRGGSDEEMAKINAAYDVLADAARRARYDETGADSEIPTVRQRAMSILANLFQQIVLPLDSGWIDQARRIVIQNQRECASRIESQHHTRAQLERRSGKVKAKGSINLFQGVIDNKLAECDRALQELENSRQELGEALSLLDDYEAEAQPEAPRLGNRYIGLPDGMWV